MTVINMECLAGMMTLPDNSVDAIVTDPPYGLSKEPDMSEVLRHWLNGDDYDHGGSGFMGKSWDSFVPGPATWREALRVLKPGGYALVFAGSRTQDLMSMALRLAGFEIRDTAMWLYGSGFPKSLNVSKAIDKRLGAAAGSNSAKQWEGYGTALKPAYEPIIIARKPLGGTVAEAVLKHGTGALNIDGCRVGDEELPAHAIGRAVNTDFASGGGTPARSGRWPANILHDGSDEVVELFPDSKGQQGDLKATGKNRPSSGRFGDMPPPHAHTARKDTSTSAARYFYCAKTSKADRNAGCEHLEHQTAGEVTGGRAESSVGLDSPRSGAGRTSGSKNHHPTVKPTELMRWCCRLVGHPGALILDPFSGSGSTGRGAVLEGFNFMGFQWDPDDPSGCMVGIANARIAEARSCQST